MAFSGVTLYLVCVSTLLAALQPLALFSADTSPSHPLQQDSVQPPANVQVGQMVPTSHLAVPAVTDIPPHWEEVWPPNRSLLHPATSGLSQPYNSTPPGLTPTPDTSPGGGSTFGSTSRCPSSTADGNKGGMLGTILEGDAPRHGYAALHHKANWTSLSHHVAATPSFCMSVNKCRKSLAKVETPQAQDLSYHQKGTFHWDPFINSSLLDDNDASMMTFIVQYLTPHWIS